MPPFTPWSMAWNMRKTGRMKRTGTRRTRLWVIPYRLTASGKPIGMPSKIRRKRTCSSSSGSISGLRPASAGYRNRSTTRGIFPLTGTSCGDGCATAGWTCPVRRISRPWFWLSRHGAMTRNTSCFLSSGCRKTRWNCGAAGTMSYTTSGRSRASSRRRKGTSSIMVSSRSSSNV